MDKIISIIIPMYNVENTISKAIDSILNNTYQNYELILVDDESNDNTLKICEKYQDERIKIIKQKHAGVSAARNNGIKNSKGDYIGFIDGDDYVDDDYLESLLNYALENDLDWVESGVIYYWNKDKKTNQSYFNQNMIFTKDNYDLIYRHLFNTKHGNIFLHSSLCVAGLYKRDRLNNICFKTDISNGEDILFNYDVINNIDRYGYLNKNMYHYLSYQSGNNDNEDIFCFKIKQLIKEVEISRNKYNDILTNEELLFVFNRLLSILTKYIFHKNKDERKKDYIKYDEYLNDENIKYLYDKIHPNISKLKYYRILIYLFKSRKYEYLYYLWFIKNTI